jgi:hypothetical protein
MMLVLNQDILKKESLEIVLKITGYTNLMIINCLWFFI